MDSILIDDVALAVAKNIIDLKRQSTIVTTGGTAIEIAPDVRRLPDGTLNYHYALPTSSIANYVLMVPGVKEPVTIPAAHISVPLNVNGDEAKLNSNGISVVDGSLDRNEKKDGSGDEDKLNSNGISVVDEKRTSNDVDVNGSTTETPTSGPLNTSVRSKDTTAASAEKQDKEPVSIPAAVPPNVNGSLERNEKKGSKWR